MNTETQINWTKEQLLTTGKVSRNDALKTYFTRLGARIDDLHKEGWEITGRWEKTEKGKDYVYYLKQLPETYEGVKIMQFNQGNLFSGQTLDK